MWEDDDKDVEVLEGEEGMTGKRLADIQQCAPKRYLSFTADCRPLERDQNAFLSYQK